MKAKYKCGDIVCHKADRFTTKLLIVAVGILNDADDRKEVIYLVSKMESSVIRFYITEAEIELYIK